MRIRMKLGLFEELIESYFVLDDRFQFFLIVASQPFDNFVQFLFAAPAGYLTVNGFLRVPPSHSKTVESTKKMKKLRLPLPMTRYPPIGAGT